MRFTDLDWREILNEWNETEIEYLRDICNEKLMWIHDRKLQTVSECDL